MTNSIRILSMQALLAAALAAQPSLAGQFDGPTGTEADRMTAVLGRLDELTKSLNSLVNELKNLRLIVTVRRDLQVIFLHPHFNLVIQILRKKRGHHLRLTGRQFVSRPREGHYFDPVVGVVDLYGLHRIFRAAGVRDCGGRCRFRFRRRLVEEV